jgi:hypothetical protein
MLFISFMKIKNNDRKVTFIALAVSLALFAAAPVFAAAPRAQHASGHGWRNNASSVTASGTVTAANGSSFTMLATTGPSAIVDATNATVVMSDGSPLPAANIEVNDSVTVTGTVNGSTVVASRVTDNSLRRFERVSGTVSSVSGTSFAMQTTDRGAVTVNIAGNARVSRNGGLNGSAYPVAGEYARATGTWDQANKVLWTTDVRVSQSTTNNGYNNNVYYNNANNNTANGSVSLSFSPYVSTLYSNQSTTVTANAYDANGIANVSIYANGSLVQTCPVSNYPTSYSCTVSLDGSNYANYSTIAVYGQLSDRNGNTAASSTTTLTTQNGTGSNGASSGTVSISVSPSSTLANGQSATVNASAYDATGIRSIGIYVNGSLAYTCPFSAFTASFNCTTTLYGGNYANGSTVSVYAQMTDTYGNVVTSSTTTITVSNTGSSGNGTVSLSLSPYSSTLANGQTTTVTATAYDPNGVTNTNLYVNGSLAMACPVTNSPTTSYCTVTLNGGNYANGSIISIYAQATDNYGNTSTSPTSTLTVANAAYGATNEYVTLSLYPYVSTLGTSQSTTLTAAASDMNGVSLIGIYVNGSLVQTCPFGSGLTNASCTYNIAGGNYAAGSNVSIYAQATDVNGTVATSSTSNLTVQTAAANGSTTTASLTPRYGERRNGRRWDGRNWR